MPSALDDAVEHPHEIRDPRPAERVVLQPRADRRQDVPGLGGAEDHDQIRRRFLERLEQRARGLRLDLVGLVHDRDAVARRDRRVAHAVEPVPHLVDAPGARRRVDLQDVKPVLVAGATARLAPPARLRGRARSRHAVEAPGEDPRDRRLAGAARAREEVGTRRRPRAQGVPERSRHVVLAHHVREHMRAMAVVEAATPLPRDPVRVGGRGGAARGRVSHRWTGSTSKRSDRAPTVETRVGDTA